MPSSPLRIAAVFYFFTLANAQVADDGTEGDRQQSVRHVIAGVVIGLVILITILTCWLYAVRRRKLAQFIASARQNQVYSSRDSNTYDVNNRFNYHSSQAWMGPPPAGPPPPGYTPTAHPGHVGPFQPPSQPPPGYGDKSSSGNLEYPPPPGSPPPPAGRQQYPPPPGPPPPAHVHS